MMVLKRGRFITVEGCEGVGKSTNIDYIAKEFDRAGVSYILTREPGGTPLAEDIRNLLLNPREEKVTENTELLLMFASRAQHIEKVIEPALSEGVSVICDRFTDASFAYQGGGRGIERHKIADLEQWVQGDLRPDYTILLDAPIAIGMARVNKRGALDRMEQEQQLFFEKVREAYLSMAREFSDRYRVVDASKPLSEVQSDLLAVIDEIISSVKNSNK